MHLVLKAILIPFGYISYYVTRYAGKYHVMYDDRKSKLVQIGTCTTLRMTIYLIKYHIKVNKEVSFSTEEVWESFTEWKLYDFAGIDFDEPTDFKAVWGKTKKGKRSV